MAYCICLLFVAADVVFVGVFYSNVGWLYIEKVLLKEQEEEEAKKEV